MSAPDGAVATVNGHGFEPRNPGQPWGLCTCGLSQAAHDHVRDPYEPTAPRVVVRRERQDA